MSVYAFQILYHYPQRALHAWSLPVSAASPYPFPLLIHYLLFFFSSRHTLDCSRSFCIYFSLPRPPSTLHMTESSSSSPPVLKWSFRIFHFTHCSLSQHLLFSSKYVPHLIVNLFVGLLILGCLPSAVNYNRTSLCQDPCLSGSLVSL